MPPLVGSLAPGPGHRHHARADAAGLHAGGGAAPRPLRRVARALGGWDEKLRVNQDFEFDYRLRLAGHRLLFDPELVIQLPSDSALGSFRVVDEVAFGSAITEDFSIIINRIEFGEAPTVVEDRGGMPMVIADDEIYYNGFDGLVENSLDFDDPHVISDGGGLGIYAIAVHESSVWYAVRGCIYEAPR